MENSLVAHRVRQHGVYARDLRAHLGSLAMGLGLATIFRSSGIARFAQGGVVKTFRCADLGLNLGSPLSQSGCAKRRPVG